MRLARSLDGGLTWKHWDPPNFEGDGGKTTPPPASGVDFSAPGFAFKMNSNYFPEQAKDGNPWYDGKSWFYSTDKGATWHGPFSFPGLWESPALNDVHDTYATSRSDYVVLNRTTLLVFKSVRLFNGLNASGERYPLDKVFVTRTSDGRRTWQFLSWVVPPWDSSRAVMPSTVRLPDDGRLLCALRRRNDDRAQANWIDLYQSKDDGASWSFLARFGDCGGDNGNPPALARLKNGTLACAYLVRGGAAGLLKVQVSMDGGRTWDRTVHVRENLGQHNGYPRLFERTGGRLCVVYMGDPQGDDGVTRHVTHKHATVFALPEFPPSVVTHLSASSQPYRLPELEVCRPGSHVFVNQSFRLDAQARPSPREIEGATLIATAAADRDLEARATLLSFSLAQPATIYVAYDASAKQLPAWLKGWTDTGLELTVRRQEISGPQYNWIDAISKDAKPAPIPLTNTFRLHSKAHPAGRVRLGGNDAAQTGARMNYFVIVRP